MAPSYIKVASKVELRIKTLPIPITPEANYLKLNALLPELG